MQTTTLSPHRTPGRVASAVGAVCLHASVVAALVWLGTRPFARPESIVRADTPIAVLLPAPPAAPRPGRDPAHRAPPVTVPSIPHAVSIAEPPPAALVPAPPPPPAPMAVAQPPPNDSARPAPGDARTGPPGLGSDATSGSGTGTEGDYISVASPRAAILPPLGQVPGAVAGRTYRIRFWVAADGRVTRVAIDPPMLDDGYRRDLLERLLAYQFYPARTRSGTAVASVVTVPLRIGN